MEKKKIMIVDDDKELLEEFREALTLNGYEVFVVNNASSLPGEVLSAKPDVILLDLKMPGKSGFQVAEEIKQISQVSRIPIIAMTGYFTEREHSLLMNVCGIFKCLKKPFNPSDIIGHIEAALVNKA